MPEMVDRCSVEELKSLFLFKDLGERQLETLCREGFVTVVKSGFVCREGDPADFLFVLLEGSVVMTRRVGGDDVEVSRTSQPGVFAGAFQAYLGDRINQAYGNSLIAAEPSRFYVLSADRFAGVMRAWFPMALHLLEGLYFGTQSTQNAVEQRERLLALGSLSAGLTHELNNPASAAVRAASALRSRLAGWQQTFTLLATRSDQETVSSLMQLEITAKGGGSPRSALSSVQASDLEESMTEWLESHDIAEAWDLAPAFVEGGLDQTFLEQIATEVSSEQLEETIRWLNNGLELHHLIDDIQEATNRIATLIAAAKQYSQLDRGPFQTVDVHELLDSTLTMLAFKIGDGIRLVRDYDPQLPLIRAYASELNQVWTNLVDNAIGAMAGTGTLTVRTSHSAQALHVEIGDTGPGVPNEIRERIYEPFFTTKPYGEGTGLGLDISWRIIVNRHHGDLRLDSKPGDTRFQVRLPLSGLDVEKV